MVDGEFVFQDDVRFYVFEVFLLICYTVKLRIISNFLLFCFCGEFFPVWQNVFVLCVGFMVL